MRAVAGGSTAGRGPLNRAGRARTGGDETLGAPETAALATVEFGVGGAVEAAALAAAEAGGVDTAEAGAGAATSGRPVATGVDSTVSAIRQASTPAPITTAAAKGTASRAALDWAPSGALCWP